MGWRSSSSRPSADRPPRPADAGWRVWTEDPLPGPGTYVVPGALAPLVVADEVGTYVEPDVWLVHAVPAAA